MFCIEVNIFVTSLVTGEKFMIYEIRITGKAMAYIRKQVFFDIIVSSFVSVLLFYCFIVYRGILLKKSERGVEAPLSRV